MAGYCQDERGTHQANRPSTAERATLPAPAPPGAASPDGVLATARDGRADELAVVLQRAVAGRASEAVIQRVHYPHLRAVIPDYAGETAGTKAAALAPAVAQKIKACQAAYPLVRGTPPKTPLTLTKVQIGAGLAGLGGPFDKVTESTTMTGREWMALLNRWRDVFNQEYFVYSGPKPANFPGPLSQNFNFTPQHDAWLLTSLQGGVGRDTPQQQADSEVFVQGGRLMRGPPRHNRETLDTEQSVTWFKGMGWEIFVLSHDGHLHAASHLAGTRHHSSLLGIAATNPTQAKDSAAAGEMKVSNGKVQKLSVKTGHYQAKLPQMRQLVQWLMKRGADLRGTELLNFDGTVIAADGHLWWAGQAVGYDTSKTDYVMQWYKTTYGPAAVNTALTAHGWTLVNVGGGSYWQKPGGNHANAREVRRALKAMFPAHWAPKTTEGPWDSPTGSTI